MCSSDLEFKKLDFEDFKSNFRVVDGQHPQLLVKYKQGVISIETLIILNYYFSFFKTWNDKIQDPVVWPEIYYRCNKYKPFIKWNRIELKKKIQEILDFYT